MPKSYDAFISYSYAADHDVAVALESGLKQLGRQWNQRRALEVFRDQSSLSAAPDLWSSLATRLDGCRYVILLLSPAAVGSHWVDQEIEHFLGSHDDDRLLLALTDGELVWDEERQRFDPSSTALPATLQGHWTAEPLWVDLRWARSAAEEERNLRNSRFRDAVATLAAPIHGMEKDELEGADVRAYRRAKRIRRTAVSALVVLLGGLAIAGLLAQQFHSQSVTERGLRHQVEVANSELAQAKEFASQSAGIALCKADDLDRMMAFDSADAAHVQTQYRNFYDQVQAMADRSATRAEWDGFLVDQTPIFLGGTPEITRCRTRDGFPFSDRWPQLQAYG